MTLEVQGKEEKMQALQTLLAPYGRLLLDTYSQFCPVYNVAQYLAPTMLRAGDENHGNEACGLLHTCICASSGGPLSRS